MVFSCGSSPAMPSARRAGSEVNVAHFTVATSSAIHPCGAPIADEFCSSGRLPERASVTSCVVTIALA